MQEQISIIIKGHILGVDDLGNTVLDISNAVHPQNMSRIITRALSNQQNHTIFRIAFGNGGTTTDAAFKITFNPPNDGQIPDTRTWDSRLYNEIYSEIVETLNPDLGTDPGSADSNTGNRPGGDAVPGNDPTSTPFVSGPGVRSVEVGITSKIIVTCVVNADEPTFATVDDPFTFDEIGLYTAGAPASSFPGYADVNVGNKNSTMVTGLIGGTTYEFLINVDGTGFASIQLTPPGSNPTYGALCQAINTGDITWNASWLGVSPLPGGTVISITDTTLLYDTITGSQTYGFLRFTSPTVGAGSSIAVDHGTTNDMFAVNVLNPSGTSIFQTPVAGLDAGVQNDPLNPTHERERLLTHAIFTPKIKEPGRSLTITYTIETSLARTIAQVPTVTI